MKCKWWLPIVTVLMLTCVQNAETQIRIPTGRMIPVLPVALVVPSDPIDSIAQMDRVFVHSEWVIDRFLHVEIVTSGIQINWIQRPPWFAVYPTPNLYLSWFLNYESYCRYVPEALFGGPGDPQWECISEVAGAIYYQRFDWEDSGWGRRIWVFDQVID